MDIIVFVMGALVGSGLGYGVFYFRYNDTKSIDGLRGNLNKINNDYSRLQSETKELNEQNLILKEKVSEYMMKNNDLSNIVGELNRYYYYLKEGYTKATELVNMLKGVDPIMEEKIKKIVNSMESGTKSNLSPLSPIITSTTPQISKKR